MPFIHPENQGTWNKNLAKSYNNLCKFYVKRYFKEQKSLQDKTKSKSKKDENSEPKIHNGIIETPALHEISMIDLQGDKKPLEHLGETMEEILQPEIQKAHINDEEDEEKDDEFIEELEHIIELESDEDDEEKNDKANPEGDEIEQLEESDYDDEEITGTEEEKQAKLAKKEKLREEAKKYHLDDSCHEKFIEMMTYVVKSLLYSRDEEVTGFVAKICRVRIIICLLLIS